VSETSFPVYLKNNQYNTNPNFDYGAFKRLETKMTASGLNIDTFAFTFTQEGVFVFADYASPSSF